MQASDSTPAPVKPADGRQPVPKLSIAHLLLFTLTTAIAIGVLSFDRRGVNEGELQTTAAQVLKAGAQVWFAGVLGAQLAFAGVVTSWMLRRRASPAPGHWLLVGMGGDALATLMLVGTFAALTDGSNNPMIFGEGLHTTFFRIYAGLQLAMALLWLLICVKTWYSRWTLLAYLPELGLALIRTYGCLLIASLSIETLMVIGTFANMSTAMMLLHVGNVGTPLVGVVVVVLGLIDRRYHQRDWLHTLGIVLMGLRLIDFSLQWAQNNWGQ